MAHREIMTVTIKVNVKLSFWQACKLRLAGAAYVQGYIEHLLETTIRSHQLTQEDEED